MSSFEEISRPVLFEQADSSFPYWGKGSSLLIANSRAYYWITAAHVLSNMGGTAQSLRIFPSDHSKISLPFNEQYTIPTDLCTDEDYKDIFALRIALDRFERSGDAPLIAQDIEQGLLIAEELSQGDELWVIGYPSESNFIDYDASKIKTTRSVIKGIYQGLSTVNHCHEMKITGSIKLSSFDGLSGSPVFYLRSKIVGNVEQLFPMLVGMILQGTASSSIARFVSSNVIANLILKAESNY